MAGKFLDSVRDGLRIAMIVCVSAVCIVFIIFAVAFDRDNYDITFSPRMNDAVFYGVEYKEKLALWKVLTHEDKTVTVQRIYPR